MAGVRVHGCEPDGGDIASGDPGWRSVSGQAPHCAGLTGDRGKCLVLRLLYSYMARGTAMKKRVWSYVSGSAPAPGEGSCSRSLAANFCRDWIITPTACRRFGE